MAGAGTTDDADPPSTLGMRLRALRNARNQSLTTLAKAAGTSASFLSQVERSRSSVSLATLQRIADALEVDIADFFDRSRPVPLHVMRPELRPTAQVADGVELSWVSGLPMRHLEVCYGTLQPGAVFDRPARSDSQELLLIEQGCVYLNIGGAEYKLEHGASIEYSSSMPYSVRNSDEEVAVAVWVMTPPTRDAEYLDAFGAREKK